MLAADLVKTNLSVRSQPSPDTQPPQVVVIVMVDDGTAGMSHVATRDGANPDR